MIVGEYKFSWKKFGPLVVNKNVKYLTINNLYFFIKV